jgi:hypothetical protein
MRENQKQRGAPRQRKKPEGFGKLPWMPEELPAPAKQYWPRQTDWPTDGDIRSFIDETDGTEDVRLAVLTGLRRWSEPGSSQLMVSLGSLVVAIAAIGVGFSNLDPRFYIGVVISAAIYLIIAFVIYGRAAQMDERRKMAHAWIRAIEDELSRRDDRLVAKKATMNRCWPIFSLLQGRSLR